MLKGITNFVSRYLYAAMSCIYLFAAGFLFVRNRLLIYKISSHFGYPEVNIPVVDPASIIPLKNLEDSPVQVLEPIGRDGNVSAVELFIINLFIKAMNPVKIFEMGTFDGRTTLNMARNSADHARIWTIDLPRERLDSTKLPIVPLDRQFIDKPSSGTCFAGREEEKKITQLYGDTATYDFSPFFSSMDLVFIDASHSYEYVLNDSRIALKLLKDKKGVIIWHDYMMWEGVTRALKELYSTEPEFKDIRHIEGTSLACLVRGWG